MAGGIITLTSTRRPVTTVAFLLASPVEVTPGVGGWESTQRDGRRPALWWRGQPETTMTIDGIIDQAVPAGAGDVQSRVLRVVALGRKRGGTAEPSPVRVTGDAPDPHTRAGGLWVVTGVTLGERLYTRGGVLRRQNIQVTLTDFDEVAGIRAVTIKRTRTSARAPRKRTVTTRRGDTIRVLAVRELGDPSAWLRIRNANPRTLGGRTPVGPDEPLRPGVRVVVT